MWQSSRSLMSLSLVSLYEATARTELNFQSNNTCDTMEIVLL